MEQIWWPKGDVVYKMKLFDNLCVLKIGGNQVWGSKQMTIVCSRILFAENNIKSIICYNVFGVLFSTCGDNIRFCSWLFFVVFMLFLCLCFHDLIGVISLIEFCYGKCCFTSLDCYPVGYFNFLYLPKSRNMY